MFVCVIYNMIPMPQLTTAVVHKISQIHDLPMGSQLCNCHILHLPYNRVAVIDIMYKIILYYSIIFI